MILLKFLRKLLVLCDFLGVPVASEFSDKGKELGNAYIKDSVEKSAVLGIKGIKRLLLNTYNYFSGDSLKSVKAIGEALECLVS